MRWKCIIYIYLFINITINIKIQHLLQKNYTKYFKIRINSQ